MKEDKQTDLKLINKIRKVEHARHMEVVKNQCFTNANFFWVVSLFAVVKWLFLVLVFLSIAYGVKGFRLKFKIKKIMKELQKENAASASKD